MNEITLVTGNAHKLKEWQRLVPSKIKLRSLDLDLVELQTDSPIDIIKDKAKQAYSIVKKPIIVEDVSAGLVQLDGLPGPFIKFFLKRLGPDALYQLANFKDGTPAIASCIAAYYDGQEVVVVSGDVKGSVVKPRGDSSFGFDATFVPNGSKQTYAEMDGTVKDSSGHRGAAVSLLIEALAAKDLI